MISLEDIARVLRDSRAPLTVGDIASKVGGDVRSCDAILWDNPEHFVWQPDKKWMLARKRSHVRRGVPPVTPDSRSAAAAGAPNKQLRATTLSNGLTIEVDRRPLDSDAFFSVRSVTNRIALTLNSSHEVFDELPMPFEGAPADSPYKALCEVLLSAWALYEDGISDPAIRRHAQDSRLAWGRRVFEMLRESRDD